MGCGFGFGCIPDLGWKWSYGDFKPAVAEETGTECEHCLCAITGPAHASLFHALLNQGFGSGFDGAAADGEAGLAIGSVVHAPSVFPQVSDSLFEFWRRLCGVGVETQDATEEKAKRRTRRGTENTLTPFYPRRTRRAAENTLTPFYRAEDAEGRGEHLNTFLSAEGRGGARRTP